MVRLTVRRVCTSGDPFLPAPLRRCVRQSAELESLFVAVERVVEYGTLPVEDVDVGLEELQQKSTRLAVCGGCSPSSTDAGQSTHARAVVTGGPVTAGASSDAVVVDVDAQPQPQQQPWPQHGGLVISGLTLRYRADLAPVLRGISFAVEPGMKVRGRGGGRWEGRRGHCRVVKPGMKVRGGAGRGKGDGEGEGVPSYGVGHRERCWSTGKA